MLENIEMCNLSVGSPRKKMLTKISLYLKIALLVIIIACLIFIGIQYIRIKALQNNIGEIKIENAQLHKDNLFFEGRIKILTDFTNSNAAIEQITNIIIFDNAKQNAINKIIEDFYKCDTNINLEK